MRSKEETERTHAFVSGFVSILGRPNTGKSTLLNALVKTPLAIVSPKPQTTRTTIQGVLTTERAQIVFLDTPGIHRGPSKLNARMMDAVREALQGRDLFLLVTDAAAGFREEDGEAVAMLRSRRTPVLLVLNKIDRLRDKSLLLPLIAGFGERLNFEECLPVSALTGEGLDELMEAIIGRLPEGPRYFPTDHLTDQPERFLAAEIVREQILRRTRQEVPHAIAVLVDQWEDKTKILRIAATVYVERDGQKGIIIGQRGAMLKEIGTQSRRVLESLLEKKIYLELFVKVRPGWREDGAFLREMDWRSMSGTESGAE
ncbi:MAG: GTPase Era [Bryobacteraceae bacterium]